MEGRESIQVANTEGFKGDRFVGGSPEEESGMAPRMADIGISDVEGAFQG